jgi:alkylation response protein AidB-like acyl-CoA dehydrogenase
MAQIEFSDEQTMLLETAADFCRKQAPMDVVRASIDTADGIDPAVWQEMAGLGWLAIVIPEEYGGLGLALGDVVPIVESMGRHLMSSPYVATILATQALVTSASEEQKQAWLPRIAEGAAVSVAITEPDGGWELDEIEASASVSGDSLTLSGQKTFVLDAPLAEAIVVSALVDGKARLILVEKSSIPDGALTREVVIDETRRSYHLNLDGIKVPAENLLPGTNLKAISEAALLLISAEIAGGLVGVLHVIIEYLNTRKAFDRLIGSYQALKHPTVDILLSLEGARSHLYHAVTALAQGDEQEFATAVHMAKAQGSEAFAFAGDRAVQFHGGFGFTYECDAQLYLRRALWCQYQFGDERYHRQKLAPLLFD